MQIVCPNCGARYDVPSTALAAPGRHVQCAACHHAWFHLIVEEQATGAPQPPVGPARNAETQATAHAAQPETAMPAAVTNASPGDARTATDARENEDAGPAAASPRREIDPEVLRILREEAAFEAARRQEHRPPPPPETEQAPAAPDPARPAGEGIATATPAPTERKPRETAPGVGMLRRAARSDAGTRPVVHGSAEEQHPARAWSPRNLPVALSAADRAIAMQETRRRGFRAGFTLTAGACCLVLGLYLAAPILSDRAPSIAPAADAMVSWGERAQTEIANALRRAADRIPGS